VPHEIPAFLRREELQRDRDELDDLVEAAWSRRAQEGCQLRKRELDGIEVGAVRRQESDEGPRLFNGGLHRRLFMDRPVVEHPDVAGSQRGHEHLFDVGEEGGIVDRAVEDRRRLQAVPPQRGDHGVRLPVSAGRVIAEAQAAWAAAVASQQIGRDAGFVEKDEVPGIAQRLRLLPVAAGRGDVRTALFVGVYGFF
jgi:hypothetical protein